MNPNTARQLAIFVLLGVLVVVLSVWLPNFLTAGNLQNVAVRATPMALVAVVMTLIIITGNIDVSVGSMLGVVAWVVATLTVSESVGTLATIAITLLVGAAMGALNGLIVGKGKVLAIIATLGMLFVWRSVLYGLWNRSDVFASPVSPVITEEVLGVPVGLILVLVAFGLFWHLLQHRRYGRRVFAVGNNAEAARLAGINVDRTVVGTYALLGVFVGIAAMFYVARTGVVQAFTGEWFELGVIASVLIGGTRITGGRGSVSGTLGGAAFVAVLQNGVVLAGIPSLWADFALGAMILIAVGADALLSRRAETTETAVAA